LSVDGAAVPAAGANLDARQMRSRIVGGLTHELARFWRLQTSGILARCAEHEKTLALIYRRQKCRRLIIVQAKDLNA
jgi:hypothetical protein